MILFNALIKLKNNNPATLNETKERLLTLKELPSVSDMQVHLDVRHSETEYDMLHHIKFKSMDALNAYMADPKHLKVGEYMETVRAALATHAYESE
jgi:hypothetical protein